VGAIGRSSEFGGVGLERLERAGAAHRKQIGIDAALLQECTYRLGAHQAQRQVGGAPALVVGMPVSVTLVRTCRFEDMVASSVSSPAS
jgi:hypothetical protein